MDSRTAIDAVASLRAYDRELRNGYDGIKSAFAAVDPRVLPGEHYATVGTMARNWLAQIRERSDAVYAAALLEAKCREWCNDPEQAAEIKSAIDRTKEYENRVILKIGASFPATAIAQINEQLQGPKPRRSK